MSQENLQLRFDGPELEQHQMDAALAGTALIAMRDICKEANGIANGNFANIQVLIEAEIRANCVSFLLLIRDLVLPHAQTIITNFGPVSPKEILEWIGILKSEGKSFIDYLLWKKERKNAELTVTTSDDGKTVAVQVTGDNNKIEIPTNIYIMSLNPQLVEAMKKLSRPVQKVNGIDKAVFIHNGKEQLTINQEVAAQLQAACAGPDLPEPQQFEAHIVVHGPILDTKSKHWKFKMNGHVESIDISGTNISEEAIHRGGVNVGDTYKVRVEMKERTTKSGGYAVDYRVLEVLDFRPGTRSDQGALM